MYFVVGGDCRRTLRLAALLIEHANSRGTTLFLENLVAPPREEDHVFLVKHPLALALLTPPPGLGCWVDAAHCPVAGHSGAAESSAPAPHAPAARQAVGDASPEPASEGLSAGAGEPPELWKAPSVAGLCCLKRWIELLRVAEGPFARFACDVVRNTVEVQRGRHRDSLPLSVPLATEVVFPLELDDDGRETLLSFLRVTVAGLNWMFAGARRCPCPAVSTVGHKHIFATLLARILVLAASLDDGGPDLDFELGAENLLGNQSHERFPKLRADAVDIFPTAGQVSPLKFIPDDAKSILCDPTVLFDGRQASLPRAAKVPADDAVEYAALTVRELRAGKLDLAMSVRAAATSFVVGKKDSQKQREVWHGGQLSALALPPPPPPFLASPGALTELQASDDVPLVASSRDAKIFFDQLACPEALRDYFGKAAVEVRSLLQETLGCERGMSLEEVQQHFIGCEDLTPDTVVVPRLLTVPMGFSWASYLAQSTMVGCLATVVDPRRHVLAEVEARPEFDGRPIFTVATDDVFCFERQPKGRPAEGVCPEVEQFEEALRLNNVVLNDQKSRDRVHDCTVLGLELRGGLLLAAGGRKIRHIWSCVGALRPGCLVTKKQLESLTGILTWHNLLARGLLSCLHRVYQFGSGADDTTPRPLPGRAHSELLLNASLAALWCADLRRDWSSTVAFSDASTSFGYGLCFGRLHPEAASEVARRSAPWPHHAYFTDSDTSSVKARAGLAVNLQLSSRGCKEIFSVRSRRKGPPGQLEAVAVGMGLQRLLRSQKHLGKRILFGLDAQAVLHALRKGRSSSWSLRGAIGRAGAISLAGDLKMHFFYIASNLNVADGPSRGVGWRKVRSRCRKLKTTREDRSLEKLRHACSTRGLLSDKSDWSELWSTGGRSGSA
jgi:hypothetical protein